MENNKVTIRFESSAANPLVEHDILMSGPVELFAVLDELEELQDEELITEVQSEIDKGRYNPIVYVENVTNYADSSRYRGAYFRYDGVVEGEAIWTEILLGTHSHKNIEMLEKLSGVNIPENAEESVMVLKTDGTLSFETVVDITTKLLCLKGMVNSKNIQFLEGVFIYPKEYFCPIDFKTSVCTITPNTHTIHHYSATWLPWYMKLEGNIWQAFGLGKQFYFTRLANKIMRIFK